MSIFQKLTAGGAPLRACFYGEEGDGKTYTAVELAIFTRDFFGLKGPIAYFDTEKGSIYRAARIKQATGQDALVVHSRHVSDLRKAIPECKELGVSVLIVDSVTQLLEQCREDFLAKCNSSKLYLNQYQQADRPFNRFVSDIVNMDVHVIFCARARDIRIDIPDPKKPGETIQKTIGRKANSKGLAYEVRLYVEMKQQPNGDRNACIRKDCFDALKAGTVIRNPKGEDFAPHLRLLKPDEQVQTDITARPQDVISEIGDHTDPYEDEIEVIKAECDAHFGRGKDDKAAKLQALKSAFDGRITPAQMRELPIEQLRSMRKAFQAQLEKEGAA